MCARGERIVVRAKAVFRPSRTPFTRARSTSPCGSAASVVHVRPPSRSGSSDGVVSASSATASETDQAGTIPSSAGGAGGTGARSAARPSTEKRATWIGGGPARMPTRPGAGARFSAQTTSAGLSRSATYTSARSSAKTTRIVNQSPSGNAIGAQKPGPW